MLIPSFPQESEPTYTTLTTLALPLTTSSSIPPEYPSVVALTVDGKPVYLASAGDGVLHVITHDATTEYDIPSSPATRYPFLIHAARPHGSGAECIISRTIRRGRDTSFEVSAVDVRLDTGGVDVGWTLRGEEHVAYVQWIGKAGEWIVAGSQAFDSATGSEEEPMPTPTPRRGTTTTEATEYPYTWSQTHDSVTITFPLTFPEPARHAFDATRDILCHIHDDALTLRFPDHGAQPVFTPAQGTFFTRGQWDFWDAVRAGRGESTWTFEWTDRGGTVTLDLAKRNAGVRWASAFAPQDGVVDVPETLTPEQIAETADRMAKWTAEGDAGLEGEDDDFDFDDEPSTSGGPALEAHDQAKVGTRLVFTSVTSSGEIRPCAEPVWALSTDLDGPSVIVKSHVDGQLFTPTAEGWKHTSTNPALAFVLASKRDTQFVHHLTTPRGAIVVAFESSRPDGTGGNAYVYWPVDDTGERTKSGKSAAKEARQAVVKFVRGDEAGALMGVASVVVGGQTRVVGLCERAWVVLEGL